MLDHSIGEPPRKIVEVNLNSRKRRFTGGKKDRRGRGGVERKGSGIKGRRIIGLEEGVNESV